jgi:hypothetical protein
MALEFNLQLTQKELEELGEIGRWWSDWIEA